MKKAVKFVSLGSGNAVSVNRIVSVVTPDSAPSKRLVQEARSKGLLVDATGEEDQIDFGDGQRPCCPNRYVG